jgi:hypothetical protein
MPYKGLNVTRNPVCVQQRARKRNLEAQSQSFQKVSVSFIALTFLLSTNQQCIDLCFSGEKNQLETKISTRIKFHMVGDS